MHSENRQPSNARGRFEALATVLAITLCLTLGFAFSAHPASADQTADAIQPTTSEAAETSAATEPAESDGDGNDDAATASSDDYGIATQGEISDDNDPLEIFCLALVDREWVYVDANGNIFDSPNDSGYEKIYTTCQDNNWGGKGTARWYVTGDVLEKVYGPKFGFTTHDLARTYATGEGQPIFPHVEESSAGSGKPNGSIWADTFPWYNGSDFEDYATGFSKPELWRVPGIQVNSNNTGKRIFYYYVPNNDELSNRDPNKYDERFTSSENPADSKLINANTFYSVDVTDVNNIVYQQGKPLPETSYARARKSFSYTLKAPGTSADWCVYMDGVLVAEDLGRYSITPNGDGTVTYTFPYTWGNADEQGVTGHLEFIPKATDLGSFQVVYSTAMTHDQLQDLGDYKIGSQYIDESANATLNGKAQLVQAVEFNGQDYTVLAPDTDQVIVTDANAGTRANGRRFIYDFGGWKVANQDRVLQPGDTLTADELAMIAPSGILSLKAQWSMLLDNGYSTTCNFFVNTTCEVEDNLQNGFSTTLGSAYTNSIYGTSVYGAEGIEKQEDGKSRGIQVTLESSEMNCYEIDEQLRNSATTPIGFENAVYYKGNTAGTDPVGYTGDGITIKRMPSDEEALAGVRAWVNAKESNQVTIDGEVIPVERITSANFTVRWYTLKNEKSDGWHIDGVLVAKKAQMVVTKTFEGDSEAIDALSKYNVSDFNAAGDTKHFYINVTHTDAASGREVCDYQLLTVPDSEVAPTRTGSSDRRYGYSSYDATTHTYIWEVDTRQGREYSVQEMNSVYMGVGTSTTKWNNSRWVNVRNSQAADTNGWIEYDKDTAVSVRVKAATMPADLPISARQTVSFRNLYVHSGTLVVRKTDYTTGDPMAGVKFSVANVASTDLTNLALYRKVGTHEYTTDTAASTDSAYEKVEDGKAETDENGTFYLDIGVTSATDAHIGTYKLVEDYSTAPGYTGAKSVTVTVSDEEGITGDIQIEGDGSGITWAEKGKSNFSLNITNRSQELTTLAAKKNWESADLGIEGAAAPKTKPVTVQLWRRYGSEGSERTEAVPDGTFTADDGTVTPRLLDENGNATSNSQVLSEDNNWCFRWSGLPLFIDNYEVTYFLRETWIGDTSYDASADADSGYASYKVTYDSALFTNAAAAPDVSGSDYKAGFDHATSYWTGEDGKTVFSNHELLAVNNSEKQGQITFTKKDREGSAGKPLAGATFALYYDEACTRPVDGGTATSTDGGMVSFPKLPVGTYYFKETQAPAGYTYDENAVYKAVVSSGDPVITRVGDASQTHITSITNKFGAALKIYKVGGGDQPLAGAQFKVEKADGTGDWATAQTGTTAADGSLWITGVEQGTYTVTETKAANGYETPENATYTFTVETDGTNFTVDADSTDDTFTNWRQVSDASEETGGNGIVFELTVRNKALYSLPTTGGMGIGATTLIAVTLMCAAVWARSRQI